MSVRIGDRGTVEGQLFQMAPALGTEHEVPEVNRIHRTARIAEVRAVAELVSRGFDVATPVIDSGTDLIVFRGRSLLRLQIKATEDLASERRQNGSLRRDRYMFQAHKSYVSEGRRRYRYRPVAKQSADVWLLHVVAANRWWVMPALAIGAKGSSISIGSSSVLGCWEDRWEVLDELFEKEDDQDERSDR